MKPIRVLIPDGEQWEAVKVIRCLDPKDGFRPFVLSARRDAPARCSSYCYRFLTLGALGSTDRRSAVLEAIDRFSIDVVLPVTYAGTEFVAANRDILSGVVHPAPVVPLDALKATNNKWLFCRMADDLSLPVPRTALLVREREPRPDGVALAGVAFPALVKPTVGGGGGGIVRVDNSDALDVLLRQRWGKSPPTQDYMIQEFLGGVDLCLGAFCLDGDIIAYTLQRSLLSSSRPFGPQRAMDFIDDASILETGATLLKALNWRGVAYVDFRVDQRDGRAKLLEMNPRFGQAVLGSLAAGVNFPLLACRSALGLSLPPQIYRPIRFIHPMAHLKLLARALTWRGDGTRFSWRESGLRFTARDPLPEIVFALASCRNRPRRTPSPACI